MRGARALAVAARAMLVALVVACAPQRPVPDPREVTPPTGYAGEDTTVRIVGDGILPALALLAGRRDGDDLDVDFAVRLLPRADDTDGDPVDLVGVSYVGPGELTAVVPSGLAAGLYDVEVTSPSGEVGVGEGLFTARDTQVQRVALEVVGGPGRLTPTVFSEAEVIVSLEGADGEPIVEDRTVAIVLEGEGVSADLVDLRTTGLDGARALAAPAVGVTGSLGVDGVATVFPMLRAPASVTVRALSTDDTTVLDDDVQLEWQRGEDLSVHIQLPEPSFVATAGETFTAVVTLVDQFGLPVPGVAAKVGLTDDCASWGGVVDLAASSTGSATIEVNVKEASGTDVCPLNRLVAVGSGPPGESDTFEVRAGVHSRFSVVASPNVVTAGGRLNVVLTPTDAFGNATAWTGTVSWLDDGGGISGFSCMDKVICSATVVVAGTARVVTVVDTQGKSGRSNPFNVVAAEPARLGLSTTPGTWVAGDPNVLSLSVLDEFGNVVSGAAIGRETITGADPASEVVCTGPTSTTAACTLFTATEATTVTVSASVAVAGGAGRVVAGSTPALRVINGALAQATVTPDAVQILAGEPLGVDISTFDAWGNPYKVRTVSTVVLSDTADAGTPSGVLLGAGGAGRGSISLRRSGRTRLVASAASVELGQSASVEVLAGPPAALQVTPEAPWAFVGMPLSVRIEAVDAYGNRARQDDLVEISSSGDRFTPFTLAMVNGIAVGGVNYVQTSVSDLLIGSSLGVGLAGTSAPILVGRDCVARPTVALSFGGEEVGRACLDDEGLASVTGSFVGSTASAGRVLVAYALAQEGAAASAGSTPSRSVTVSGAGQHPLGGLVMQDDGCATEVTTDVWAGPDDGSVVGPIEVEAAVSSLSLGGLSSTSVSVSGATTCSGALASGAQVRARTDRGALYGLVSSGAGLTATLDAVGHASFALDVGEADMGGATRVRVWWADSAAGATVVSVSGDERSPQVWGQTPRGAFAGEVDELVVRFSEPITPISWVPTAVDLVGPYEVDIVDATLDTDRRVAHVWLAEPISGAAGESWTLLVGDAVSDPAGNRLDGTWDGGNALYTGPFGSSSEVVAPITSCAVSSEIISPDGDDGPGAAADQLTLSFGAASTPAWWVVAVFDAGGQPVRRRWIVPSSSSGAWTWDGRDVADRVVDPGDYTVRVDAEGALGNLGGACAREVTVVFGGP